MARGEPVHRVVATAAHIEKAGELTRLVFALSAPVSATAFVLADPDRVIVDLPEVDFRLDPTTGHAPARGTSPAARAPPASSISFRFGVSCRPANRGS